MKTIVAGFGNVLLGDDGFGVEVVRRFAARGLPQSTETIEVGIGGFDFVLRLMDGYDRAVIVDLVRQAAEPGTLIAFTPPAIGPSLGVGERIDPHIAEPSRAMQLARHLRVLPDHVTIIGCEPEACDVGIGLSPRVAEAAARAIALIDSVISPCTSTTSMR